MEQPQQAEKKEEKKEAFFVPRADGDIVVWMWKDGGFLRLLVYKFSNDNDLLAADEFFQLSHAGNADGFLGEVHKHHSNGTLAGCFRFATGKCFFHLGHEGESDGDGHDATMGLMSSALRVREAEEATQVNITAPVGTDLVQFVENQIGLRRNCRFLQVTLPSDSCFIWKRLLVVPDGKELTFSAPNAGVSENRVPVCPATILFDGNLLPCILVQGRSSVCFSGVKIIEQTAENPNVQPNGAKAKFPYGQSVVALHGDFGVAKFTMCVFETRGASLVNFSRFSYGLVRFGWLSAVRLGPGGGNDVILFTNNRSSGYGGNGGTVAGSHYRLDGTCLVPDPCPGITLLQVCKKY